MVSSSKPESPVSGLKLSSVVPAKVTGNKDHSLSNTDLALKLHYIKAVYFFDAKAVEGLCISDLKKPMFQLLQLYYTASGRIRRSEDGRPFIKCNDGGVRVVEAFCDMTVDEWLGVSEDCRDDRLVYNQVLGPDLAFSPLVYVQFTWFKSGGLSLGLNWAHVLGDPFSVTAFLNTWGQLFAGHVPLPSKSLHVANPNNSKSSGKSSPVKTLDPVGDHWRTPGVCPIESHTFRFYAKQLDRIRSDIHDPIIPVDYFTDFEVLSALIWKSLSKIKEDTDLGSVTICVYDSGDRESEIPANAVAIRTVEADFNPRKGQVSELAALIADKRTESDSLVEEIFEKDCADPDVLVYGSKLTFVDMEGADVYGFKLRGEKPVFVNYAIDGVGEEGVVMVLRGPEEDGVCGRTVTVVLPGNQLSKLKIELKEGWGLV